MLGITKVFADTVQTLETDAQVADKAAQTMANLGPLVMMVALFVIMYFIIIRPQRKKEKEAQAMINALTVGDKIVTIGGICGKVVKIKDDFIFIETGNIGNPNEKTVLKMERQSVKTVEKKSDSKKVESIPDDAETSDTDKK